MPAFPDDKSHSEPGEGPKHTGTGVYLYAAGSIAAALLDMIWRDFEEGHQPIQALGDHIPGREIFAYIAAIWLIVGGVAILRRATAQSGAWALAGIYTIFGVFWLPRFYTAPHVLGFRIPLLIGLTGGVAQQCILVAAAGIVLASLSRRDPSKGSLVIRWTFGLSSIIFGLGHLTGVREVGALVPKWMPFGGSFWAVLTGIAFVLAGVAMLSGIRDVLAAQLLGLMLLVFSVLVLIPGPFAHPRNHIAWGSNAYNLAAVGAVWMFAESIVSNRRRANADVLRAADSDVKLHTKLA